MEKKGVVIGGKHFKLDEYEFLMTRFKESFSHASLSVERAFEKLEDYEIKLNRIKDTNSLYYYQLLDRKERKEIDNYLKQFIVFFGCNSGEIRINFNPSWSQKEVDDIFSIYFKHRLEDAHYVLKFDKSGKFDKTATFHEYGLLFKLLHEVKELRETAYNMKKDHMDAFDYAMSLDEIGIKEIIEINEKINHSRPEQEKGFKNTNNAIFGARFDTTDKVLVPIEMQNLVSDYKNDFGLEILDYNEEGISHKERHKRLFNLFKKEAIFHIRLMRIHPFNDGNGRTGRIIINKHLIEKGLAPVLITGVMKDDYKEFISEDNYDDLAKMLFSSSSQVLSGWVSMRNVGLKPKLLGESNAKLAEANVSEEKKPRKKALSRFRNNTFII